MASEKNEPDETMVAARKEMWGQFVRFSTYAIVGIAVILILMALFLL